MKENILYLILVALFMVSCQKDDEGIETNEIVVDHVWGVDPTGDVYKMAYFDLNKGNIAMFDFEGRKVDMIFNEEEMLASIAFNEKGLIESVYVDSLTLILSNHHDNKVDVALMYDDEIEVIKEYETQINWDELTYKVPIFDSSVDSRNFVLDAALDADKWLREHQNEINEFFEVTDKMIQAIEGAFVLKMSMPGGSKLNMLKKTESLGRFVNEYAIGLGIQEFGNGFLQLLWDVYEEIFRIAGDSRFNVVKQFNVFQNFKLTYKLLKYTLKNYTRWSDFCEKFWYERIASHNDYHKQKEGNLLRIAINSYESTLPPIHNEGNVTFSMGTNVTYTRIGQDVKEWGVALFKGNELVKKYPVENIAEATQNIYFTFEIPKTQFNLDYDNYVAKPKDNWYLKSYEINNQNPNISVFGRSQIDLELVYNQTPGVTFYDLEVGETIDINEDNYTKKTYYGYKYIITGTLFMEDCYVYYSDTWATSGKGDSACLWDGRYQSPDSTSVSYSSTTKDGNWCFVALVNGKQIHSTNYLHFHVNEGIVEISLIDGTPDSSSRSIGRDSKSYGFVGNTSFVRVE